MHTLLEFSVGDFTVLRELKELTNLVGDPDSLRGQIKFPDSELRRFSGEGNAFLEFAQSLFFSE